MPEAPNNPTPDPSAACPDEWLSAYVDGELTAAERAAVEARLAADPAAQRTVDAFRTLARDLHALPSEPAPAAFASGVAERLEASPEKAAILPQHEPGAGRLSPVWSPRRWAWAAVAVAAAVVIAFVTDRPDGGQVAKQVATAAAPGEDAAEPPASEPPELLSGEIGAPPAPADAPPLAAAADENGPRLAESSPAPSAAAAPRSREAASAALPRAIVRLALNDTALTNREFDRVLANNRIRVEAETPPRGVVSQLAAAGIELRPARGRALALGDKRTASPPTNSLEGESANRSKDRGNVDPRDPSFYACNTGDVLPKTNNEVEYVLVDAAAPVVERCLVSFTGDADNFRRVEVEPTDRLRYRQQQVADSLYDLRQQKAIAAPQQQSVEPWQAYNRAGSVANASRRAYSRMAPAPASKKIAKGALNAVAALGSAYRFSSLAAADDPAKTPAPAPTGAPIRLEALLKAGARSDADASRPPAADRVQVLFVLEAAP